MNDIQSDASLAIKSLEDSLPDDSIYDVFLGGVETLEKIKSNLSGKIQKLIIEQFLMRYGKKNAHHYHSSIRGGESWGPSTPIEQILSPENAMDERLQEVLSSGEATVFYIPHHYHSSERGAFSLPDAIVCDHENIPYIVFYLEAGFPGKDPLIISDDPISPSKETNNINLAKNVLYEHVMGLLKESIPEGIIPPKSADKSEE